MLVRLAARAADEPCVVRHRLRPVPVLLRSDQRQIYALILLCSAGCAATLVTVSFWCCISTSSRTRGPQDDAVYDDGRVDGRILPTHTAQKFVDRCSGGIKGELQLSLAKLHGRA